MSDRWWATRRTALVIGLAGSAGVLVFTQRADAPAAFSLALAALAGVGLLLIVGRRLRPVVGVLLVGLGAALTAAGVVDSEVLPGLAGSLVVAAGILTVIGGRSWGDRGARYLAREPGPGSIGPTPGDAWRALDAGVDPTVDDPA